MTPRYILGITAALVAVMVPATANTVSEIALVTGGGAASLPLLLQCVPYARTVSGVQIYGDAWTWWQQAEGKYARGVQPKVGAVMAFKPYGKMQLGHVAAVSRLVDSRTVLLRHANWSLINGTRGQIEDNVKAIDVSPNNDWSKVRVWFAPLQGLGGTAWPVHGFIYGKRPLQDIGEGRLAAKPVKTRSAPETARNRNSFANDPIGAIIAASLKK